MLGEYPQESESDYMTANDSGQTSFFLFRIRLGKLDNFWMILPEGPVRTSGQRINEAYSRDHDQFQRFGAWDLETSPKKSPQKYGSFVSCRFSGTRVTKQHALLLVWGLFSGGGKRKGGFGGHECAGWGRLATVEGLAVRGTAHGHGKVF